MAVNSFVGEHEKMKPTTSPHNPPRKKKLTSPIRTSPTVTQGSPQLLPRATISERKEFAKCLRRLIKTKRALRAPDADVDRSLRDVLDLFVLGRFEEYVV